MIFDGSYFGAELSNRINLELTEMMASAGGAFEYTLDSAIRGFHVYQSIWIPVLNEQLKTCQEHGNAEDLFAVAVWKEDTTGDLKVGHVPREIARICWYFLEHDGEIVCTVTGNRRRSPLVQGGLEIPCKLKFIGKRKHIKKLKKLLT